MLDLSQNTVYMYIWTFSLRGVLTFVASGLDINGCMLNYFEGTANVLCYTSYTLTTLHCSKVSFLQCYLMKRYNNIFTKMWGVYSLLWDTVWWVFSYEWLFHTAATNNVNTLIKQTTTNHRSLVHVVICHQSEKVQSIKKYFFTSKFWHL